MGPDEGDVKTLGQMAAMARGWCVLPDARGPTSTPFGAGADPAPARAPHHRRYGHYLRHERGAEHEGSWCKLRASEVKALFDETGFTNAFWAV